MRRWIHGLLPNPKQLFTGFLVEFHVEDNLTWKFIFLKTLLFFMSDCHHKDMSMGMGMEMGMEMEMEMEMSNLTWR